VKSLKETALHARVKPFLRREECSSITMNQNVEIEIAS